MKTFLVSLLFAAAAGAAGASELTDRIKVDAQACAEAVVSADYETLARFTHPKLIEMLGGREQMIALVAAGLSQMEAQGFTFVSATVGEPEEPRTIGDLLVSMLAQTLVLQAPAAKITQESALLGVSSDGGATWVFLDLGPVTDEQFAEMFPELADEVTLPPKKQPIVERL